MKISWQTSFKFKNYNFSKLLFYGYSHQYFSFEMLEKHKRDEEAKIYIVFRKQKSVWIYLGNMLFSTLNNCFKSRKYSYYGFRKSLVLITKSQPCLSLFSRQSFDNSSRSWILKKRAARNIQIEPVNNFYQLEYDCRLYTYSITYQIKVYHFKILVSDKKVYSFTPWRYDSRSYFSVIKKHNFMPRFAGKTYFRKRVDNFKPFGYLIIAYCCFL